MMVNDNILKHLSQMDFRIVINLTSLFPILDSLGGNFHLHSKLKKSNIL